jgi:hypothetical protein
MRCVVSGSTVTFESEESKTVGEDSVFNSVVYSAQGDTDVWMMRQSHGGHTLPPADWDRLAIVVDTTKTPPEARYYQLAPGDLVWTSDTPGERIDYRVSCFFCHPNGPRAIRPTSDSKALGSLSIADRVRIALMNLKIKSYGRVVHDKRHDEEDKKLKVPFRFPGAFENAVLDLPACERCHREEGWLARGSLRRQNAVTIEHMSGKGHMPPFLFALSEDEKQALSNFLNGI